MNKHYVKINDRLVPLIYGGMSYQKLSVDVPTDLREKLADDRDVNIITSTDYFYGVIALGEGPIYKINPNGPQDMEFNDSSLDDLINLDTDGSFNNTRIQVFYSVGNANTAGVPREFKSYFGRVVSPQSMSSSIVLKKGNIVGIPAVTITQSTTNFAWDGLEFNFTIGASFSVDDDGNNQPYAVGVRITMRDRLGNPLASTSTFTNPIEKSYAAIIQTPTKFSVKVNIPEEYKSDDGYQFTIEKINDDTSSPRVSEQVTFNGWDEISYDDVWYTRTALMGIILKSHAEYSGAVPTITSMQKGLYCKVPANYDQPILSDGQIDWRNLEVAEKENTVGLTGDAKTKAESNPRGYTERGYRLESMGATSAPVTTPNPVIYKGVWDGSFVKKWTQNPAWIIYDLLTDTSHGLGIPEEYVDKFKFYKVAQYCDAVDSSTGKFTGVDGYADGTFRHKPIGYTRTPVTDTMTQDAVKKVLIRENQVGLPAGTPIKERRFICNVSINTQRQVLDVIGQLTALFRGVLIYSGGKISLNVDLPNELPVAIFNESNIIKDSLQISGIKESDILTGVEVSYMDPTNHYKRELVRIDDQFTLQELSFIENIKTIDLVGCDRRSQAMRFGQYLLASSKYVRRRVGFKTTSEALNLSVGDVIAVSQKMAGVSWGYGGKVAANTALSGVSVANVLLEHFTTPALTSSVFSSNTYPIGLRIINRQSDRVDLYLANGATTYSTGNAATGVDLVEVSVNRRLNPSTRAFDAITRIDSNIAPVAGDVWSLGEVNPATYFNSGSDKLFKIAAMERDPDDFVSIQATEYVSNVYEDSDSIINYSPVRFPKPISPIQPPPPVKLDLRAEPVVRSDGALIYNVRLNPDVDLSAYPYGLQLETLISKTEEIITLEGIN